MAILGSIGSRLGREVLAAAGSIGYYYKHIVSPLSGNETLTISDGLDVSASLGIEAVSICSGTVITNIASGTPAVSSSSATDINKTASLIEPYSGTDGSTIWPLNL